MTDPIAVDPEQYEAAERALAPGLLSGIKPEEKAPVEPVAPTEPVVGAGPVPDPEPVAAVTEPVVPTEPVTPEGGAEFEDLEDQDGIKCRKYGDAVKYRHVEDGNEVWLTLREMRDGTQSMSVAQKRFREAAETQKQIDADREAFRVERESFDRIKQDSAEISKVLAPLLDGADYDPIEPDDPAYTGLSDKVDKLTNLVQGRIDSEEKQVEALQAKKELDAGVQKAFGMVGNFLKMGEFNPPPASEQAEQKVALHIATQTGGYNEEYYKRASDPQEVLKVFNDMYGLKSEAAPIEGGSPATPPSAPIQTSVKPRPVASGLDALEKEKKTLEGQLDTPKKFSKDEFAMLGARHQEVTVRIDKLKQKGG